MPMIEFRYQPQALSHEGAAVVGEVITNLLHCAIAYIRPEAVGYSVTVEGDPFGVINHNQPDLRIYIFYHEEWLFTSDELSRLAAEVAQSLENVLKGGHGLYIKTIVRFYSRTGHACARFG